MHICSIRPYFSIRSERRKTVLYLSLCLIDYHVFVMCSFTILHRLAQLCFTRVVLDAGVSCKWIIASVNRFMHWKVGFQSLCSITCFKNWIYQPTCQGNPNRFITFMVQTRFKSDNTINKNSIFSTKRVASSTKGQVLLHFSLPYLFIQLPLQSSTTIPTIRPIQAAPKIQWASEFCVDWHCFNLFPIPQNMDRDNTFTITDFLLLRLNKFVYCR